MPPLPPRLPFLSPTQPTAPTEGGISQEDMTALMEFLESTQQPLPPIQKPSVSQRVAAGLGDAFLAAANVLSRGAAPQPQATAHLREEESESRAARSRVEESNLAAKRQAGVATFSASLADKRARERDEATLKRQEEQSRLVAERQREIENLQAQLQERRDIAMQVIEFQQKGGVLPPGFDITKATYQDLITMNANLKKSGGISQELADALAVWDVLRKRDSNLQIGAIDLGPLTIKPKEADALSAEQKPVTDPTARQASQAGVVTTGMTESEAREALAAERQKEQEAAAAEKAARAKRLGSRGLGGAKSVRDEIISLDAVIRDAQKALDLLDLHGDIGGPVAGRVPYWMTAGKDWLRGSNDATLQIALNESISTVRNTLREAIAGKAVTPYEGKEMEPRLPALSDILTKKRSNLEKIIEQAKEGISNRMRRYQLTDEDIGEVRGEPEGFIKSTPPDGAYKIGGTH